MNHSEHLQEILQNYNNPYLDLQVSYLLSVFDTKLVAIISTPSQRNKVRNRVFTSNAVQPQPLNQSSLLFSQNARCTGVRFLSEHQRFSKIEIIRRN